MMRKPVPGDFQISETDLGEASRIRRLLIVLAIAWSGIGLIVGTHLGKKAWPLIVLTVPPYGPVIFYYLAKAAARFLRPAFGRTLAYEAAIQRYEQWWTRTRSDFSRGLSGRAFEVELANLYRRLGFDAQMTSTSTDKGVDIWIVRDGHRVPVQCKAHRAPVTPGAARELYGTMQPLECRQAFWPLSLVSRVALSSFRRERESSLWTCQPFCNYSVGLSKARTQAGAGG